MRHTAESYAELFVDEFMGNLKNEREQLGNEILNWMKDNQTVWHPYSESTVWAYCSVFPVWLVELLGDGEEEVECAGIEAHEGAIYITSYYGEGIVNFIEKHNGIVVD